MARGCGEWRAPHRRLQVERAIEHAHSNEYGEIPMRALLLMLYHRARSPKV